MVSICLTTYNGGVYIREQLDSILSQISESDEILISDDGSTDNTIAIIESYKNPQIKLYKNKFHNLIKNFEFVLSKANGNYVFLSDQDDVWEDNKVEVSLKYLSDYELVVSDCKVVDEELNIMYQSFFSIKKSGRGFFKNLKSNTYLGCCMAFNRSILSVALPFPNKIPMHDIWLGILSESRNSSFFIDEALVLYRRHGENASITSEKSNYSLLKKISFRVNTLIPLILRIILTKR